MQCSPTERLEWVTLRTGQRLDAIGINCRDGNGGLRQETAGGGGGQARTLNIVPSRFVRDSLISIGKCGKSTTRVCGVQFEYDNGFMSGMFGTRTGDTRQITAGANQELVGFRGRSGQEIDNLEPVYRLRQGPPFSHTRRIGAGQIATAIDVILSTLQLHLNNIGPRRGNSWHAAEDSFIRLAGDRTDFDIPEYTKRPPNFRRRYFYYVNDVNARNAGVEFERDRQAFILKILLEDEGREIKGKCRLKRASGSYRACPGANEGDGDAPDVQWSFPQVEVVLVPQIVSRGQGRRNGVGLRAENVRLKGDFNMNGLCGRLPRQCRSILDGWKGKMITTVEGNLRSSINGSGVQGAMADATRPLLNAAGIPTIVDAVIDGRDVELRW